MVAWCASGSNIHKVPGAAADAASAAVPPSAPPLGPGACRTRESRQALVAGECLSRARWRTSPSNRAMWQPRRTLLSSTYKAARSCSALEGDRSTMRRSTVAPCTMQARATPPSNCKSAPTQLCHRQTATRTCSLCTVMAKRSSTSGRCTRRLVRPSLLTNADFRFNAKEVGLATSTGRGTMMVSPEGSSVPPEGQFRLSVGLSSVSSTFTNRGARGSQTSSPGCALRSRRSTSLRSSSRTVKDRIVQKLPLAARIGAFCVLPPAPAGVNRVLEATIPGAPATNVPLNDGYSFTNTSVVMAGGRVARNWASDTPSPTIPRWPMRAPGRPPGELSTPLANQRMTGSP